MQLMFFQSECIFARLVLFCSLHLISFKIFEQINVTLVGFKGYLKVYDTALATLFEINLINIYII